MLVGAPLVAVTQPFLPPFQGAAVLVLVLAALSVAFWRSATNLQEHARAGAQAIVEVLASQAQSPADAGRRRAATRCTTCCPASAIPSPLRLKDGDHAVGKTLAELNLRGLTAATVLAILRDGKGVLIPTGKETLRADDVLALAGAHPAIDAARSLLLSGQSAIVAASDSAGDPPAEGMDQQPKSTS